jgi:hypothetical protein
MFTSRQHDKLLGIKEGIRISGYGAQLLVSSNDLLYLADASLMWSARSRHEPDSYDHDVASVSIPKSRMCGALRGADFLASPVNRVSIFGLAAVSQFVHFGNQSGP